MRLATWIFLAFITTAAAGMDNGLGQLKKNLQITNTSIELTRQKIKQNRDLNALPDLYMTLADFQVQRAGLSLAIRHEQNPKTPLDELDTTVEKRMKEEAIETYNLVITRFPNYSELDKALNFLGNEYLELGQGEKSLETFHKLTERFPQSKLWDASQFAIGNHYFEKKDFAFAMAQFAKILERPEGAYTSLARFRIGWCQINQSQWQPAFENFEKIFTGKNQITAAVVKGITDNSDVKEESLIASIWPYLELKPEELAKRNDLSDPIAYYEKNSTGDQVFIKVLLRLARRLEIKKRSREQARALYLALRLTADPEQKLPLLEAYYLLNRDQKIGLSSQDEIEQVFMTLEPQSQKIKAKYEPLARDVATQVHKSAAATHRQEDLILAIKAYETYLHLYPKGRFENEMRVNMAEGLFQSGQFIPAATAYEGAAKTKKANVKELMGSAIEAYIEGLKQPEKLSLVDRTQGDYGFQSLGQAYLKKYPGDRKCRAIEFNMAKALFDRREFSQARETLRAFISKYPRTEEADSAGLFYLDSFFQENDLKSLAKEGRGLLTSGRLTASANVTVKDLVEKANLRTLRQMAGDFGSKQYSDNLIRVATSGKDSSLGEPAMYEAFLSAKSSHDPQTFAIGETYLAKFANAANAKSVHLDLIQMSLRETDYRSAARYLESFNARYPQDPQANDFLEQAENLYKNLLAVEDLRRVSTRTGHFEKLAGLLFQLKRWAELVKTASQIQGLSGAYYQGIALYHSNDTTTGLNLLNRISEMRPGTAEERLMVTHSRFVVAQDEFQKTRRSMAPQTLSPALIKSAAIEAQRIEAELARVMDSQQGRWVLAALYTMGELQLTLVKFFQDSQPPPGLTREQLNRALGPQIQKAKQRAQQFFTQCQQLAKEKDILSRYALGCRNPQVAVLDTDEFAAPSSFREATDPHLAGLRQIAGARSQDTLAWMKLAENLYQQQDYPQMRMVLSHALEASKPSAAVCIAMAYADLYLGDTDSAAAALLKALAVEPGSKVATVKRLKLQQHFTGETPTRAPASANSGPWRHPWVD
jgi:tetratricopeptide (TPR) repeat protein